MGDGARVWVGEERTFEQAIDDRVKVDFCCGFCHEALRVRCAG